MSAQLPPRDALVVPVGSGIVPEPSHGPSYVPVPVPVPVPAARLQAARSSPLRPTCANPDALGVSRVLEIDPTGGPTFGFQQYKDYDILAEGEIVLTFDDGPMPAYTRPILDTLEAHCTKATFFVVGRMALAYPETVKDTARRGHTIGTHTWSHTNLGPRKTLKPLSSGSSSSGSGSLLQGGWTYYGGLQTSAPRNSAYDGFQERQWVTMPPISAEKAQREIELGFSAVSRALGQPTAPFFRFPFLGHSQSNRSYLGSRNIAMFSIDVDSLDYRAKSGEEVTRRVLSDLSYQKKGILLFHDIQPSTVQALPSLLIALKARGYRVVHLKSKAQLTTIASFDAAVDSENKRKVAETTEKPLAQRSMTWGMQKPAANVPAAQRGWQPAWPAPGWEGGGRRSY